MEVIAVPGDDLARVWTGILVNREMKCVPYRPDSR
jgi:hypothetical protein